jgi:hypothetical protein
MQLSERDGNMKRLALQVLFLAIGMTFIPHGAHAQQERIQRWARLYRSQFDAFITDVAKAFAPQIRPDQVEHAKQMVREIMFGDTHLFRYSVLYDDEWGDVWVKVTNDAELLVGAGSDNEGKRAIIDSVHRAHWLKSLGSLGDRVRLRVLPQVATLGQLPPVVLALETEHDLSCVNIPLNAEVARGADSVTVTVLGKGNPGLCMTIHGPATFHHEMPLNPGVYQLIIRYLAQRDVYRLQVSDTSLVVQPITTTFTFVDETLRWRFPPNSLAVVCRGLFCDDVLEWIAAHNAMRSFHFPDEGINPYDAKVGKPATYFRYSSADILDRIRQCVASIQDQIREAVGVGVRVTTWSGETIRASSERSFHEVHTDTPDHVTGTEACTRGKP